MKLFYSDGKIVTIVDNLIYTSIMRSEMPLGFMNVEPHLKQASIIACDHHHSLTDVLCPQARRTLTFPPYGTGQIDVQLPIAFKGEWFDMISSSYLLGMGKRAYSPAMMRFRSPDSISPFGAGGVNSYAFVSGDPINFSDPSGQWRSPVIKPQLKTDGPVMNIGERRFDAKANDVRDVVIIKNSNNTTTIMGHGNVVEGTIGGYTPRGLMFALRLQNEEPPSGPIHLIVCGGARGPKPIAKILSNITGSPVTSYKNGITAEAHGIDGELTHLEVRESDYSAAGPKTFYPRLSWGQRFRNLFNRIRSAD